MDKLSAQSPQWQPAASVRPTLHDSSVPTESVADDPGVSQSESVPQAFYSDQFTGGLAGFADKGNFDHALDFGLDFGPIDFSDDSNSALDALNKHHKPTGTWEVRDAEYGEKLGLYNNNWSTDKPFLELQVRRPRHREFSFSQVDPYHTNNPNDPNYWRQEPQFDVKLRSPLAKQMLRDAGDNLIKNPLKSAYENGDFSLKTAGAAGLATALVAGAVFSPEDVKTSTRLFKTEVGGYELSSKAKLRSGQGDIDLDSVRLSLRPEHQKHNEHWSLDFKYDIEDDQFGLSYSKSVHYGGHGASSSNSYFHAGITHNDKTDDTEARVSYHYRF